MNKYRQQIADLTKRNKEGGHESESLVYLALADSFQPLFNAFCSVYSLDHHLVVFDSVLNALWEKWTESIHIDAEAFGNSIEVIAPSLERYTHRTACYAQDACILAHAACTLLNSRQDIEALYYYFEPFEGLAEKEFFSTLELSEDKWEEEFLLRDKRVDKAFKFIDYCISFASNINAHSAQSFAEFRCRISSERWTAEEMNVQANQ